MHEIIILAAKDLVFILPLIPAVVWLKLHRADKKQFIIIAFGGAVLALIVSRIAEMLFYNPRPFVSDHVTPFFSHAMGNGFPSDHTLLAGVLAYLTLSYNRPAGYVALGLAFLVGWARVLSNVHHGIDIVTALAISGVSMTAVVYLQRRFLK